MTENPIVVCPRCRSLLVRNGEVMSCGNCGKAFPVVNGVVDFSGEEASEATRHTVKQFGESWQTFDHIEPYHEQQFLEWIAPFPKDGFTNKSVLEAGCGKGRHTINILRYAPSAMAAVDLSEAIFLTAEKIRAFEASGKGSPCETILIRSDLKNIPLPDSSYDVVFCVGVLHHVDRPEECLKELWRVLKPGGRAVLWVYAREGNGWIVNIVDPLRKSITSKIPARLLRILSLPLTSFLFVLLKALYGPLSGWGKRESFLPYSSYLGSISPFPFREIDNIVVDHLCPEVAYYLSKADIEEMFEPLHPSFLSLRFHHKNSWTVIAEKQAN